MVNPGPSSLGRYSSIIQAVINRIESHRAPSGLLSGYSWSPTPEPEIMGQSTFPALRLWMPDMNELENHVVRVSGDFVLKLTLSCDSDLGIVRATQQLETTLDCLEFDAGTPNQKDLSFGRILESPVGIQVKDNFAEAMSLNFHIFLTAQPNMDARGNRRRA